MSEPFIGEIRPFPYDFAPEGWLPCDGRLLPIADNQVLYSLIGSRFPHTDTHFALPDMEERTPIGSSAERPIGATGGEVHHTLSVSEMPAHWHEVTASGDDPPADGNQPKPTRVLGRSAPDLYADTRNPTTMLADACSEVGGPRSHTNVQPFLALQFCIAIRGTVPQAGASEG